MAQNGQISQLRRGTLPFCVLALLSTQELYGFELVQELGRNEGMVTSEGTIYPLLSRLRREGLIDSEWRESESGPPRRYYTLSAAGKNALSAFEAEWQQFRDSIDAVLATRKVVSRAS